jgi:hypothetical protein
MQTGIKNFEQIVSQLYNFFFRGHKKALFLKSIFKSLEFGRISTLKYINDIKWCTSEYKALELINIAWSAIVEAFKRIIKNENKEFSLKDRQKAQELLGQITSKIFLITQYFLMDILAQLSHKSLELQKQYITVINAQKIFQDLIQGTFELNKIDGIHTQKFLDEVKFADSKEIGKPVLKTGTYLGMRKMVFRGIELNTKDPIQIKFPDLRHLIIEKVVENLKTYFKDDLHSYAFLKPMSLPLFEENIPKYGEIDFKKICNEFRSSSRNWDCLQMQQDFENVLNKIIRQNKIKDYVEYRPEVFWPFILNLEETTFSEQLKSLIHTVLTLPIR